MYLFIFNNLELTSSEKPVSLFVFFLDSISVERAPNTSSFLVDFKCFVIFLELI